MNNTKIVTIPAGENHNGMYYRKVILNWVCPVCGAERGEVEPGFSYDGSLRLEVDTWKNPCGHIDGYKAVRLEAATNGLNT